MRTLLRHCVDVGVSETSFASGDEEKMPFLEQHGFISMKIVAGISFLLDIFVKKGAA